MTANQTPPSKTRRLILELIILALVIAGWAAFTQQTGANTVPQPADKAPAVVQQHNFSDSL